MEQITAQRRTIHTLVTSQAIGAVGMTIGIATASLLARDLSGSEQQAGLAQTSQVIGAAAASWLLAGVMARRGRRAGLTTGYLVGAGGAALAVLAGVVGSMPLLLVGMTCFGATTSANYAARYAATDLATHSTKGRSLSIVVWATTIGAVAGPNLTGLSAELADRLHIPELTGPFAISVIAMSVAALVVNVRLRPDPLLLARELALTEAASSPSAGPVEIPRLAEVLRERPVIIAAIAGLAAAHAVMVSVMVMTPLHMANGGSALRIIGIVISVHVLGMFAFAPLVGLASDQFPRPRVLATGGVVLLVSLGLAAASPKGSSVQIFAGLFLLGLGWSIATVSASTIIAEEAPLLARTRVQGFADLTMNLSAAVGGGLSGVIVAVQGFATLSGFAALFAIAVLAAAWYAAKPAPQQVRDTPTKIG